MPDCLVGMAMLDYELLALVWLEPIRQMLFGEVGRNVFNEDRTGVLIASRRIRKEIYVVGAPLLGLSRRNGDVRL